MWGHEFFLLEFFEGHIGEVVDSLNPSVFSLVVSSDFLQCFGEDLESEFTLFSMNRVELRVDFSGLGFSIFTSTVQEISVLDVEVSVSEAEGEESYYKEDF